MDLLSRDRSMLFRFLLKKSSLLTSINRLDHLLDPTCTSGIIVNTCFLNLRMLAMDLLLSKLSV